jgi:hypothetical protein
LAVAQQAVGDAEGERESTKRARALSSDFRDVEGAKAALAGLPAAPGPPPQTR